MNWSGKLSGRPTCYRPRRVHQAGPGAGNPRLALAAGIASLNANDFDAKEDRISDALDAARTFPFGSERRVVCIRDLQALTRQGRESEAEALLDYLGRPFTRTVLVMLARGLDRRTVFYRSLANSAALVDCALMKDQDAGKWVEDLARSRGCRMELGVGTRLVAMVGTDSGTLASEMEKLVLLAGADRIVRESALEGTVRESRQHRIFELTDALGRRDRPTALRVLACLLEAGDSAIGIVAMVAWHVRRSLSPGRCSRPGGTPRTSGRPSRSPPSS